jgi:DNA-binding response OmpR family regulator
MIVLLAISNRQTSKRIKRALERQRYVVLKPDLPGEVLPTALRANFDLLLMDAEADPYDGATVCRRLREVDVQALIIVVSATGSAAEAAKTIDAGADDVVPPSVATPELLARVRALWRREVGAPDARMQAGDLSLDVSRHAAVRRTEVIKLSVKEFRLLEFFLRHQGEVVRREDILRSVWPNERDFERNIVDVQVFYLRSKIERRGLPQLIRTVRGVGYMLNA